MSLHRSLKTKAGALEAHRNVLSRAERIAKLLDKGVFDPSDNSPLGLPKVRSIKVSTGKKKKAAKEEEGAVAEGAEAAAPAAPAPEKEKKERDRKEKKG